ncbi:EF-hand domain-containing protein [Sphingomonas hominis]|nr:EF-hand domain-containing protein [Sphingomonas hominis]
MLQKGKCSLTCHSANEKSSKETMMLKYVLYASAMTMAAPAIAQQTAPTPQSAPATTTAQEGTVAAPVNTAQAVPTTPTPDPATGTQAVPTQSAQTGSTEPASQPSQQGTNEPDQVAAILDSEFPTYDKDKSGSLSKAEFASWMDTLKAKADPSAKPNKAWNDGAFKKADSDKSASVTKTELASFLSSGTKQAG